MDPGANMQSPPQRNKKLIDLTQPVSGPLQRWLVNMFASPIERALSIDKINSTYQYKLSGLEADTQFMGRCLDAFKIRYHVGPEDLAKVPTSGPLVVVSNHPFGGAEGVILGDLVARCRPDIRILGNYLLQHIPQLSPYIFPVDPFGNKSSTRSNARTFKNMVRWVKAGSALITFPAGEVSHLMLRQRRISDPAWAHHIGAIVRMAKAKVLPVYFPGRNSSFFNIMGLLNPLLRTMLLPKELVNKANRTLKVYVGNPIPWSKLKRFEDDRQLTDYLRCATYFMKNRDFKKGVSRLPLPQRPKRHSKPEMPIINAIDKQVLAREISDLPAECRLHVQNELVVCLAEAQQIPETLKEIGRLREISFREVNEGTGQAMDIDRFDDYYYHLFVWDQHTHEIAGGYRLGVTDEIVQKYGPKGLYTSSLFRFQPEILNKLSNSIELGRSFVRSEYQRKRGCLALLWRGIGAFVGRHLHLHLLFGPVSISQNYHVVSKNLIVEFLRISENDPDLAAYVSARRPFIPRFKKSLENMDLTEALDSIEDVSMLISEIESDGKPVPPLIKHYLRMAGKFVSFNVDKNFSNVVDGLVMVDLNRTDPKITKRFMGPERYAAFARYQIQRYTRAA